MSAEDVQAQETVTPETPSDSLTAAVAEWRENRAKQADFEYANPHLSTPEPQEATPPEEPEVTPEKVEPAEAESRTIRRLMAKEAKIREAEEAYKAREATLTEREAKIAEAEKALANPRFNPTSFLEQFETPEEKRAAAEAVFFAVNDDLLTDEIRGRIEMNNVRWQRNELDARLAKLETKIEKPEKKPEPPQVNEKGIPKTLEPYYNSLETFATGDLSEYPLVAGFIAQNGPDAVVGEMWNQAIQYANEMQGQGKELSPAEAVGRIEDYLTKLQVAPKNNQTEQKQQEPPEQPKAPTKSLRNSATAAKPLESDRNGLDKDSRQLRRGNALDILKQAGFGPRS